MSKEKNLHIICHDVPWPADYGAVYDLFYKIKALHEEGIRIKLHCFLYGRPRQDELLKYCSEVYYYKRKTGWRGISFTAPYIVKSRENHELLKNLLKDDDPVLMEGIHCTAFLNDLLDRKRKVFLRLHNVESVYYSRLFQSDKNIFRKIYFLNESIFLNKYEKRLPPDLPVFAVSENDAACYREDYGKDKTEYLPVFVPFSKVISRTGVGDFCLYHGNLSVAENEKAVIWLLEKVFSKIRLPFTIAGKDPGRRLQRIIGRHSRAVLISNPSDTELEKLISEAQINVLPSFNSTGIKLKLIHALFNGRHCVVNEAAVEGSGLEAACYTVSNAGAMASVILQLYHQPIGKDEILLREKMLPLIFDNRKNARQLIQWIW